MNKTSTNSIQALVLAAGEGSRLRRFARQKVLFKIAGVPLLGRVLYKLKDAGIQTVYIVTGYQGDAIREHLGENYAGLNVQYIKAKDWEKGNLYSFLAAKGFSQDNFVLCMGDHLFDPQIVKNLINENLKGVVALAIDRVAYSSDDTKVLEQNGIIVDIGKSINPSNGVDTGLFLCSPKIFTYAEKAAKQGASELAQCIQLATQNEDAWVLDISGHFWVDVDTKKDAERAKKLLVERSQKERGASDFVAHYFNRPIENAILQRISDHRVTPNQLTMATNALAYFVTALLLFGHLSIGAILMFAVASWTG